jgi:hypothetical protein
LADVSVADAPVSPLAAALAAGAAAEPLAGAGFTVDVSSVLLFCLHPTLKSTSERKHTIKWIFILLLHVRTRDFALRADPAEDTGTQDRHAWILQMRGDFRPEIAVVVS